MRTILVPAIVLLLASSCLGADRRPSPLAEWVQTLLHRNGLPPVEVTYSTEHPFSPSSWWHQQDGLIINFLTPFARAIERSIDDEDPAVRSAAQKALCFVAAHEVGHIIQWHTGAWGDPASPQFMEREADMYARGVCEISREQSDRAILSVIEAATPAIQTRLHALARRIREGSNPNY